MSSASDVRRWAKTIRTATERRNDAIRRMRDEGASLRQIAAAAGLSSAGVLRILRQE